jgi:4-hydroxybenzoate polyprenyltransferase
LEGIKIVAESTKINGGGLNSYPQKKKIPILSWRNWGIVRYNSIWQNLAALFYIALVGAEFNLSFIGRAILFIGFSTVMTAFGYLINDFADRELDLSQGKPNTFEGINNFKAALALAAVLLVGLMLAWFFLASAWFSVLWVLWIFAAASYSLPPLRLKERGLVGLIVTIAAQQTLPVALMFAAFDRLFTVGAVVFIIFATTRGISSDISHQLRDFAKDAVSGSKTFAVRQGKQATARIYAAGLEIERFALGALVALLIFKLPQVEASVFGVRLALAWPLLLVYLPLFTLNLGRSWKAFRTKGLELEDPYDEIRQAGLRDSLHVIHHTLPSVIVPLYLNLWLALFYWPFLVFALIVALLYGLYSPQRWVSTWPVRPLVDYFRAVRNR